MAVYTLSQTGIGTSPIFAILMKPEAWVGVGGVSLLVNFSGSPGGAAVATATVQISNDINAGNANPNIAATARWNAHDVLQGITADRNSSIVYPVAYVRLTLSAWTSGTVTLQIGHTSQI